MNMHKKFKSIARKYVERSDQLCIYEFVFVEIPWEFNAFWDFVFILIIL